MFRLDLIVSTERKGDRMKKNFLSLKRELLIFAVLIITLIPLTVHSSYAQVCIINDDVTFIETGRESAILYWENRPCDDGSSAVFYQISLDGLKTWSDPQNLASFPCGGDEVDDFDGIIIGCGGDEVDESDGIIIGNKSLLASFLVYEGTTIKVIVYISDDKGQTWDGPITAAEFANSSAPGCPVLTSNYDKRLKRYSLITVIYDNSSDTANPYIISSQNGFDWIITKLGGANFPVVCCED
jgi:hypothetical protein